MTIEQLNKEMANEINRLPVGEMGEVLFDDEVFANIHELDAFMEPPPDVMGNAPENPDEDWLNEIKQTYPLLLGMYIPMRSPGQVILFGQNLRWFYWSLVRAIRTSVPYMTQLDLNAAWVLVRMKTHEHELFHYNINVLQSLFGHININKATVAGGIGLGTAFEEAFAVAWARIKIQEERGKWQSQIGRMNGHFYSLLMQRAFNYRSPGYRDWIHYADEVRLKPALLSYIAQNNYANLQANGVDMERLLYGMIGQMDKGYVERVW